MILSLNPTLLSSSPPPLLLHYRNRRSPILKPHFPHFPSLPQLPPLLSCAPKLHPLHAHAPHVEAAPCDYAEKKRKTTTTKSFWAAVSLIVGTAVGPGMLGLPSATLRSGPLPSSAAIILSWLYVISSVLLVAELSFAAMHHDASQEVSFTALAAAALGPAAGAFVAAAYACLSLSLLVACVSGIGSLAVQQLPLLDPLLANALAPCLVGAAIAFFPFEAIDAANRLLCSLMLLSITALVAISVSVGRSNLSSSIRFACWRPAAILPAVPVSVLTLGFHVITPFVCNILSHSMHDARRAIMLGGAIPLVMVLSWNFVVLGLAGAGGGPHNDPIALLLSVNAAAMPAVRGFAFAALATSLIGYAVSFPKQLADTAELIAKVFDQRLLSRSQAMSIGRVGFATYSWGKKGNFGQALFAGWDPPKVFSGRLVAVASQEDIAEDFCGKSTNGLLHSSLVMWIVLLIPIFVASFFRAAFARALDFAGVYANCFLFGVLPPLMAWIHRSRKNSRSPQSGEELLPGGNAVLILLFSIAVVLGIWH